MSHELTARWGVAELQRRLQAGEPGVQVEVVASTGSTNSALLERTSALRLRADARDDGQPFAPQILVAEQQTQGRGRQGRAWHAAPGASLTFSLALVLSPQDWSGLSLAVGVALAEALDPVAPRAAGAIANSSDIGPSSVDPQIGLPFNHPCIGLKWPNDLWLWDETTALGGRKLGGVLIETASWGASPGPRACVIGVGLNVQSLPVEGASSGVACLQELDPLATAPGVLARVTVPLLAGVRHFEREGFAGVARAFASRDLLQGRCVTTTLPGLPEGMALGVSRTGALLVQSPGGQKHAVASGEVSVRPAPGRRT